MKSRVLTHSDLLKLKRFNTPAIYNGWEAITKMDRTEGLFNREETRDFMEEMGPMIGYAVTVVIEPGNKRHAEESSKIWSDYRHDVATTPCPKIVVVQDLDKPEVIGSFWGEVNSNIHRALGCVGTITDGAIRDVDEMKNAGFKGIAKRLCVGHAYSTPVKWNCEVEVFGCPVKPGELIHADRHGFLVIPKEDQERLLEAVTFMDYNECNTVIAAARSSTGESVEEVLSSIDRASALFNEAMEEKMKNRGEW